MRLGVAAGYRARDRERRRAELELCGRIIQASGPLRLAIVDGLDVRDSRLSNSSQELLVIRRNHDTGEVSLDPLKWGLIPYWWQANQRQGGDHLAATDVPGRVCATALHRPG
jgi:hypothetical protein